MSDDAAERVRRVFRGETAAAVYGLGVKAAVQYSVDRRDLSNAFANQQPTYSDLAARLAAAEARLALIDAHAKSDEADLAKMRDGTKLSRFGLVQIIAYQQQDIDELKARLARYDDARPLTPEVVMEMGGSFTRSVSMVCDIYTLGKLTISFYIHPKSTDVTKRDELLLRNVTAGNFAKLVDGLGVTP